MSTITSSSSTNTRSAATIAAAYFTFDHITKTIKGSEFNFKKAGTPTNPQYEALMAAQELHPTYSLAPIAPEFKKQTYKGLNFDLMMEYVAYIGNDIQKAEFEEIVNSNATYPTIKSWFLDYFKVGFTAEKATREIEAAKKKIAQAELKARKAKVRATVKATVKKADSNVVEMPIAQNF